MSQFKSEIAGIEQSNILKFPFSLHTQGSLIKDKTSDKPTPVVDSMEAQERKLNTISAYKSQFGWAPIRDLEIRNIGRPIRGGIVFRSPFKLVNSHSACQQCLYAFEVDTYGRGCVHNCLYCYAKAELTQHGYWNNPYPVPVDLNEIRKTFYTVFETDKKSKWREIMEKRIPLRIGSMSDSFMWLDDKYKVTKEFLKILDFYNYPFVVFTRSDLIAEDDYLSLIRKDLSAIQFSMSSTNDELNRKIEPGAPSAKRRLAALEKINKAGIWTTVRINPLFPIHPDGFFTDSNFKWNGPVPKFDFSSFDMVDQIADAGVPAILTGFGRFSSFSLNQIQKATGFDLKTMFREDIKKSARDYHFSDREIRYYYEQIKNRCVKRGVQFTTCYIGNGEGHFWKDQDIWSNKKDCCNIKNRVKSFVGDSRQIPFDTRIKLTQRKDAVPASDKLHEELLDRNPKNEQIPEATL
jgi:DNA repair photolyase